MGRTRFLYLVFILSGLSGLIYESLWSRYLRLFVGSAATAQVCVLALFMGGMAVGAGLCSARTTRITKPVRAYAWVEAAIGLYALSFPWLYDTLVRFAYDDLFPQIASSGGVVFSKWCLAGSLVVVPSVLMGMTFPLMSAGLIRQDESPNADASDSSSNDHQGRGKILGSLYFANSMGASIGALLSGFALVPALGLPGTSIFAGCLNVFIAALVLIRDRGQSVSRKAIQTTSPTQNNHGEALSRSFYVLFLALALGTGLSSFLYEIGWIRLLSMLLGSASHSFEVMLSTFLIGMASGGLWGRRRMDKFRHPQWVLAGIQVLMGLSAVLTLPLYRWAAEAMTLVFYQDERTTTMWLLFNLLRYLICLLIMFPATFCAGLTLPLLTKVVLDRGGGEQSIGRLYGLNTLGAILGALGGGLLLMPVLGIKWVIVIGALVDLGLGIWLFARLGADEKSSHSDRFLKNFVRNAMISSLTVMLFIVWRTELDPRILAASVFRKGRAQVPQHYQTVSHVDGRSASVTVMRDTQRPGYFSLYTNGKPDASVQTQRYPKDDPNYDHKQGPRLSGDEPTQIFAGAIPLLARPDAKDIAVIGIGSGVTSHVLLTSPNLDRVDTIEIEKEMVRGAKVFDPINRKVFEDPRSHIIIDDAKAYFAGTHAAYDVIVSEPSNPWVSGVSNLFTQEFYREIQRYLKPGGMLAQWIHGYELGDELLISVLAALDREFEDYRIYRIGNRDWLLLSVPTKSSPNLKDQALQWPDLVDELAVLGVHQLEQVEALLVGNRKLLRPFLRGFAANRDRDPILENGAERARFFQESAEFLLELRWAPLPILELFGDEKLPAYPYPGILDRRKNWHVLMEAEWATRALHALDVGAGELVNPGTQAQGDALDGWTTEVIGYFNQERNLKAGQTSEEVYSAWFHDVFAIYNRVAPWISLGEHPRGKQWWKQVQSRLDEPAMPLRVRQGLRLLDAVVRRDVHQMQKSLEIEASHTEQRIFHPRFLFMVEAMICALEDEKCADWSSDTDWKSRGQQKSSEERADDVLQAWMRGR